MIAVIIMALQTNFISSTSNNSFERDGLWKGCMDLSRWILFRFFPVSAILFVIYFFCCLCNFSKHIFIQPDSLSGFAINGIKKSLYSALIIILTMTFAFISISSYLSHKNPSNLDEYRLFVDIFSYVCLGLLAVFKVHTHYERSRQLCSTILHWICAFLFYIIKLISNWFWFVECVKIMDGYLLLQGTLLFCSSFFCLIHLLSQAVLLYITGLPCKRPYAVCVDHCAFQDDERETPTNGADNSTSSGGTTNVPPLSSASTNTTNIKFRCKIKEHYNRLNRTCACSKLVTQKNGERSETGRSMQTFTNRDQPSGELSFCAGPFNVKLPININLAGIASTGNNQIRVLRDIEDTADERTPSVGNANQVIDQHGIEQCYPAIHPCTTCKIWKQDRVEMRRYAIVSFCSQIIFLGCLLFSSLNEGIYTNRCLEWFGKTHSDEGADCPA